MITLEESIKLLAEETRIGFEELRKGQQRIEEELLRLTEENCKISTERREFKEDHTSNNFPREYQLDDGNLLYMQWDQFVDDLVDYHLVPLLKSRGIPVKYISKCVCRSGEINYMFDIFMENDDTIIVVEVETTLKVDEVNGFLGKLAHFKTWLPRYTNMKVYGAVAFLHQASEAATFAEKCGLFTILATGSSAKITNPIDFEPKAW